VNKTKTGAENIHWDLTDLYESPDAERLENDKKKVVKLTEQFADNYKGEVKGFNAESMKRALVVYEQIYDMMGKIGSYAYLLWTTNTEEPKYGKMVQEVNELSSAIRQKLVFFQVEWLDIEENKAEKLIHHPELRNYQHYLETSRQRKPYVLKELQEQIMAAKSVTGRSAWVRFFDETLGAARFTLDDEELTQQQALSKLHESDRTLRRRAQQALTDTFNDISRTTTFIFNTILADKKTDDELRGYPNWIRSRNLSNEIKDETVDKLIKAVTGRYNLVQRFYALKKELLGYEELFDYDRYAPILESQKQIEWQDAKTMVLDSYQEFHPEMGSITERFFDEKWIDAAIKPGKRGGAFSAGTVPSVHPYVFMNYDGKIRDVQTLAHELGHGVHQYLAREQGILEADTPLTTAETASVFGEMLVFQHLLAKVEEPREKLALIIGKIDDTIATVFRQISMNRFEEAIHTKRREKGELTTNMFSDTWLETQFELYGDSVKLTDNYAIWWSYIPHFLHTPGYVYAYAFGELLVLALYEKFTRQPDGFADKYLNLLRAGGSDWPENLIAKMGLDITDARFWDQGLDLIEKLINEAEQLSKKL